MYRMHSPMTIPLNVVFGCSEEKCKYWYKLIGFWYVLIEKGDVVEIRSSFL